MKYTLKQENGYSYLESGQGTPLIILHGLMGNLSNFDGVFDHFSDLGYQVIMPELPIYTLPLLKTNVKNLSKFIKDFVKFKGLDKYILPSIHTYCIHTYIHTYRHTDFISRSLHI